MEESSERPWTNVQETVRDFGERTGKASSPLPTSTSMTSPDKYFSLYLTLAASITENAIEEGDPALAENLEKIDVYYLGLFAEVTEYIGRGLTYSVRRTKFENSKDVVFKSSIPMRSAKTLNGQGSLDADRLAALLLELRILTHPPFRDHQNIVNIIQVGWEGDALDVSKKWPVLVMEYADRGTLVDYFDENVSADFPTKLSLCANVTSGLQALHGCHVVHGDLKLENVLVFTGDDGQPVAKLSDFGGALLDSPNELSLHLGTPPWNAPEWRSKMLQEKLLKCDVYSLGLLLWRILLNGADPFEDESIFSFPQGREQRLAAIEAEKMTDSVFLGKVKASVERSGGHDLDRELVWSIFDCAIQLDGSRRNLVRITELLDLSFDDSSSLTSHQPMTQEPPHFCIDGMIFPGIKASLRPVLMKSFAEIVEGDDVIERKLSAAYILAMMNLMSDDFQGELDVDEGLRYLILAAEFGSRQEQALVLRFHHAFGRAIPQCVNDKVADWLLEAAKTGSMSALEDLQEHGYHSYYEEALSVLQTRYGGVGEDVFGYDQEACDALASSDREKCRLYISAQITEGEALGKDWSGYHLRLAATRGSSHGVDVLVNDFHVPVNQTGSWGTSPLLYAARAGHVDVVLFLLDHGADPKQADNGRDTPLHWLCSFRDKDVPKVAQALLCSGAEIHAQADCYPADSDLEYLETDFVAGTSLHRAVSRNKFAAVSALLKLGANPHLPADSDKGYTPIALAAKLHYPEILRELLSVRNSHSVPDILLTPTGTSVLAFAIMGGSLYGATIGRLIRHGSRLTSRTEETLDLLLKFGAEKHFHSLPGIGCTAVFYAARSHVSVLDFLLRNPRCKEDIDTPSQRHIDECEDADLRMPPLFEAIESCKKQNISVLISHGANLLARENDSKPVTALYHCAKTCFEDTSVVAKLLKGGVGVDDGPQGYETPFFCAVRHRCFVLAEFLYEHGANPNVRCTQGHMWKDPHGHPVSLLSVLAKAHHSGSVSCFQFLFRICESHSGSRLDLVVDPLLGYTIFHTLAFLDGDRLDGHTTLELFRLCGDYFQPNAEDLNRQSAPHPRSPSSVVPSIQESGGDTALHFAVMMANYEAVKFLLTSYTIDTTIRNSLGLTAWDLVRLGYDGFEQWWYPRDVPKSRKKQLNEARARREGIRQLVAQHTDEAVIAKSADIIDKFAVYDGNTDLLL